LCYNIHMRRYFAVLLFLLFFALGIPFSSAYFAKFLISPTSVVAGNILPLESFSTNINISEDLSFAGPIEGETPYKIFRLTACNQYDAGGFCINSPPNLCPYISLQPKNVEIGDVGFVLNASTSWVVATGKLNLPTDPSDDWTLSITSPCFEGECPAGYDASTRGAPLPQSLKGQTFKCDLNVESAEPPFLIKALSPKVARAANLNKMTVEAVFVGGAPKTDPVIIIPGIMGSAYKNGQLVIDPILHTYDDLIATLEANGYKKDVDLFTFPYEWRDSNVFSAQLLKSKIDAVKAICRCSKVDLVAHSMGGLVARQYIQSSSYANDVDQVIFLGTPHKGGADSYLVWEGGEFQRDFFNQLKQGFILAEALHNGYLGINDYVHLRPILSVKELLPTFDYLKDKNTGILRTYPNNYPANSFLESLNINISKLLTSGVRITNIIGNFGNETVNIIRVIPSTKNGLWQDGQPDGFYLLIGDKGLERGAGDEAVTIQGATLDNSITNQEVSSTHLRIPTIAEAKVFNILTNKVATTTFDHNYGVDKKVLLMQLLSPVDFVVTAPDGKKMGKNFTNGTEYNEIPGAFYSGYQTDEEYITILNPLDGEYKIELQGTGNGGKYTVLTSLINDATSTTAQFSATTTPNQITDLKLTLNNAHPEAISVDPDVFADINRAYANGWIKDKKTKDMLLLEAQLLIKFQLKFGTISKKVDMILAKLVLKQLDDLIKKKLITIEAYNLLKFDLNWLINH